MHTCLALSIYLGQTCTSEPQSYDTTATRLHFCDSHLVAVQVDAVATYEELDSIEIILTEGIETLPCGGEHGLTLVARHGSMTGYKSLTGAAVDVVLAIK